MSKNVEPSKKATNIIADYQYLLKETDENIAIQLLELMIKDSLINTNAIW